MMGSNHERGYGLGCVTWLCQVHACNSPFPISFFFQLSNQGLTSHNFPTKDKSVLGWKFKDLGSADQKLHSCTCVVKVPLSVVLWHKPEQLWVFMHWQKNSCSCTLGGPIIRVSDARKEWKRLHWCVPTEALATNSVSSFLCRWRELKEVRA